MKVEIDTNLIKDIGAFCFFVLLIAGLTYGMAYLGYTLNKAKCSVQVNKEVVYEGRCHFVSVNSVGQNGNSKEVHIYSGILRLVQVKEYMSQDVEIRSTEN